MEANFAENCTWGEILLSKTYKYRSYYVIQNTMSIVSKRIKEATKQLGRLVVSYVA